MTKNEVFMVNIQAPCVTRDDEGKRIFPHVDCAWNCD